jgi:hypothetical protein
VPYKQIERSVANFHARLDLVGCSENGSFQIGN